MTVQVRVRSSYITPAPFLPIMKKYNFVYQTTNLVNGKYYIGVHQCDTLDDGYLGSGLILARAISKYGKENFKREILQFFDSPEEAFLFEAEIVTLEFVSRNSVYNVAPGGAGGSIVFNRKPFLGPHTDETKERLSQGRIGKKHSSESKQRCSENSWARRDPDAQREHAKKAAKASHAADANRTSDSNKKISDSLLRHFSQYGSKVKGLKRLVVSCPHCDKSGAKNTMSRWHFDNCKFKDPSVTTNATNVE